MKTLKIFSAAALVTGLSQPTFAASEADISVVGSIAPAPCTVVIEGGRDFRFGTLMSDELNADEPTHILRSKNVTINCPAPIGLWVAFPFDNDGQLTPHAGGTATGTLAWWSLHSDQAVDGNCWTTIPENERSLIDIGDGNLIHLYWFVWVLRGKPMPLRCPDNSWFSGPGTLNGAQDGSYIGASVVKAMHIPLHLRMSINPRDDLDTSGAIQLEGSASIVVNYI